MSLRGFVNLKCKCGGDKFATLYNLVWQEGRGMSPRPAGYFCIVCQKPCDSGAMIDAVKTEHLKDQIKELEAQRG